MVPAKLRVKVVSARLSWVRRMMRQIQNLPLDTLADFTADPRTLAAAESYLRRGLEALPDLGRHPAQSHVRRNQGQNEGRIQWRT